MSAYLQIAPERIAAEAIAAAHAVAAIVHVHARDPHDGRPSPDPALFREILPVVKRDCAAIVNVTTGGGQNMTVQQRLEAARELSPEMCSLNMGSMNFGLDRGLERVRGDEAERCAGAYEKVLARQDESRPGRIGTTSLRRR